MRVIPQFFAAAAVRRAPGPSAPRPQPPWATTTRSCGWPQPKPRPAPGDPRAPRSSRNSRRPRGRLAGRALPLPSFRTLIRERPHRPAQSAPAVESPHPPRLSCLKRPKLFCCAEEAGFRGGGESLAQKMNKEMLWAPICGLEQVEPSDLRTVAETTDYALLAYLLAYSPSSRLKEKDHSRKRK